MTLKMVRSAKRGYDVTHLK